jgi:hypothetical protein
MTVAAEPGRFSPSKGGTLELRVAKQKWVAVASHALCLPFRESVCISISRGSASTPRSGFRFPKWASGNPRLLMCDPLPGGKSTLGTTLLLPFPYDYAALPGCAGWANPPGAESSRNALLRQVLFTIVNLG